MTWKSFHHRGEVLRDVIAAVDAREDGLLPMDVPGVAETFGDELTLIGALQLRWHTRLAGRIERELRAALDLDAARSRGPADRRRPRQCRPQPRCCPAYRARPRSGYTAATARSARDRGGPGDAASRGLGGPRSGLPAG